MAIFKGGNSSYVNYKYSFSIWSSDQCSKFFKKDYPAGFYFVMSDGIFHLRGPFIDEAQCIASVESILVSEDGAKFEGISPYPGNGNLPIMNEL
ncbi:hypothetical protein LC653_40215 [Nostoc sp. CHAB 5784]|uniref:hypothetical protein n=1 Tax=Nostoc mirabile TaxID=2907820 RepID=UPI001E3BA840|nr:hypothetical protein [Nostoc mirabile]MCC5669869.1 hypothetical protein [Nostoc mirabile CHAB5784]